MNAKLPDKASVPDSEPKEPETKRQPLESFILSLIGLAVAVFISILFHNERKSSPGFFGHVVGSPRVADDFHLINQEGIETPFSQWKGKVVLFSFGFTHCPSVCPTTLTNLSEVLQVLPAAQRS